MMFSEIDTNAEEKISLDGKNSPLLPQYQDPNLIYSCPLTEFVDGYTEWMMTKI
jgi:hypothetical protein